MSAVLKEDSFENNARARINYHDSLVQGSDEWLAARCGLLTASEMKLILTPTLKVASNEKERAHLYELLAQRVTQYVEPRYIGSDMLRGQEDEVEARILYAKRYAPVDDMGFITNNKWGFTLGYSPDGLVAKTGAIECKSRCQKYQAQTIIENMGAGGGATIPDEFTLQIQTGLLVAELEWIDFISYCGGMPMVVIRAFPVPEIQQAIIAAAGEFEKRMAAKLAVYCDVVTTNKLAPTERRVFEEIML